MLTSKLVLVLCFVLARTFASPSPTPGKKALFVAPISSKSHKNFYNGIIRGLTGDGFHVTLLTPYADTKPMPNLREVEYPDNRIEKLMRNIFTEGEMAQVFHVTKEGPQICLRTLALPKTQQILDEHWDIVYISMFFADCFLGRIYETQTPFVLVNPVEMFAPFAGPKIGNPSFPSFDYSILLNDKPPLSFGQRIKASLVDFIAPFFFRYSLDSLTWQGKSMGLYEINMPSLNEIVTNTSLMIFNSFRLAEHPRPYMPNILLAGGIHCRESKPLPKDLEDWVQSSGDAGFIFFSLGSAVRSSDLPIKTIRMLLSVFESLPQKVLWKFDLDTIEGGVPSNVRLTQWAPQQDLLGHPKIRLFITHGGLFSTQEAQYHGVSVLGLPVFGDQKSNMQRATDNGWGLMLEWNSLTTEDLKSAIVQLINDEEKKETSRRFGELIRDRPSDPSTDVVWWANYIIRNKGARHLRSGALDLYWHQLHNLDVWTFIISVLVLVCYLILKMALWALRCCFFGGKEKAGKMSGRKTKRA